MSDLKPCPFCGAAPSHFRNTEHSYRSTARVVCVCGAEGPEKNALLGPDVAIAAWNRRADDWQPIETAPRDGTRVMLWVVGRPTGIDVNIASVGSWWSGDADCWVEDGYDTVIPTRWRPLPEGPP